MIRARRLAGIGHGGGLLTMLGIGMDVFRGSNSSWMWRGYP